MQQGKGGVPRRSLVCARLSPRTADWLQDALTPGLRPHTWELDAAGAPPDLAVAAQLHGVEGWVRRRAQIAGLSLPGVEEAVRAALARHLRAVTDLKVARNHLDQAGVDFLVVKGPVLAEHFYGALDLRSYVDLDLLVRPGDLRIAVEALEAGGCTVLDANWPLLHREEVRELRMLGPSGGAIDLHWSLGKGPGLQDASPCVDVLMTRAQAGEISGIPAQWLDWADTVVHLAVHAAASGGHRLLWCADLRAALRADPGGGSLSGLVPRATEWGAAPAVHLMLVRTRSAVGLEVPEHVLRTLVQHSPWSAAVRAADRVFPVARHGDGRGMARLVARSAAQDGRASSRVVLAKAVAALRSPRADLLPAWFFDAAEPRSPLYDMGGRQGREKFFDHVVQQARAQRRP